MQTKIPTALRDSAEDIAATIKWLNKPSKPPKQEQPIRQRRKRK